MSMIKLAVYGALGYLVYQTFFADKAMSKSSGGGGSGGGASSRGKSQDRSTGSRTAMTGAGQGRIEETSEPDGTQIRHRVGRGVV